MKNIIAVIRNEKVEETKSALKDLGINGVTFLYVTGRGQQKGMIQPRVPERDNHPYSGKHQLRQRDAGSHAADPVFPLTNTEIEQRFLPKRMLVIVANDSDVMPIVQALIKTNRTGHYGDGKIFICPMVSAIRVRNGEQGDSALM